MQNLIKFCLLIFIICLIFHLSNIHFFFIISNFLFIYCLLSYWQMQLWKLIATMLLIISSLNQRQDHCQEYILCVELGLGISYLTCLKYFVKLLFHIVHEMKNNLVFSFSNTTANDFLQSEHVEMFLIILDHTIVTYNVLRIKQSFKKKKNMNNLSRIHAMCLITFPRIE